MRNSYSVTYATQHIDRILAVTTDWPISLTKGGEEIAQLIPPGWTAQPAHSQTGVTSQVDLTTDPAFLRWESALLFCNVLDNVTTTRAMHLKSFPKLVASGRVEEQTAMYEERRERVHLQARMREELRNSQANEVTY